MKKIRTVTGALMGSALVVAAIFAWPSAADRQPPTASTPDVAFTQDVAALSPASTRLDRALQEWIAQAGDAPANGGVPTQPSDAYGHGTHVSGLVMGKAQDLEGWHLGVAPGAEVVELRVLERQRQWLHKRRDRCDQLCHIEQGRAGERRHQLLARASDLQTGRQ